MKELKQEHLLFIEFQQLAKFCRPYVRSIELSVAYRGEVLFFEDSGQWYYDKNLRISNDKIGFFGSVLTKSLHYCSKFWSVEEAKEYAQKHSRYYNKQMGVWHDHFDKMTLKKIEIMLLVSAYSYEKEREKQQINNQTNMKGEFCIEDCYLSEDARKIYPNIINNPRISQDIKDAWLEVCVNTVDIDILCCW